MFFTRKLIGGILFLLLVFIKKQQFWVILVDKTMFICARAVCENVDMWSQNNAYFHRYIFSHQPLLPHFNISFTFSIYKVIINKIYLPPGPFEKQIDHDLRVMDGI